MSKMQDPKRVNVASKIAAAAPKHSPSQGSLGDALMQQQPKQTKVVKR